MTELYLYEGPISRKPVLNKNVLPDEAYLLSLGLNTHSQPSLQIASCYVNNDRTLLDQIEDANRFFERLKTYSNSN